MYQHYRNGVMPFSGGLYEQPAVFLEAMQLIDRAYNDGQKTES